MKRIARGCVVQRDYFGWPNSFFAELIDKLVQEGRLTRDTGL